MQISLVLIVDVCSLSCLAIYKYVTWQEFVFHPTIPDSHYRLSYRNLRYYKKELNQTKNITMKHDCPPDTMQCFVAHSVS